jgi:transcriptional repressor NrdR
LRCPFCTHEETQVVETRESDEGDVIRRRRRCTHCDKRFTTYERPEIALPQVVKNSTKPRSVARCCWRCASGR